MASRFAAFLLTFASSDSCIDSADVGVGTFMFSNSFKVRWVL